MIIKYVTICVVIYLLTRCKHALSNNDCRVAFLVIVFFFDNWLPHSSSCTHGIQSNNLDYLCQGFKQFIKWVKFHPSLKLFITRELVIVCCVIFQILRENVGLCMSARMFCSNIILMVISYGKILNTYWLIQWIFLQLVRKLIN